MKIFITGTNTDVGKTYVVTRLWQWLNHRGTSTVIFKPFQTEELEEGLYPDLEAYRTLCGLDYELTGLYT
ncbi:AAA family ATPase, partial [Staphylococcus aureus]